MPLATRGTLHPLQTFANGQAFNDSVRAEF